MHNVELMMSSLEYIENHLKDMKILAFKALPISTITPTQKRENAV